MLIHVVNPEETIYTIAATYNVSVTRLIEENGIMNPEHLVVGQTIVIAYPEQIYITKEGDTLSSIANDFQVTKMQILRNNPFLSNRDVIYKGELIVISYETMGSISINAYAYPFIDKGTLRKTLPYLTYLTIFNYRSIGAGEIVGDDDTELIQIAKEYGVAPLMSLSTLNYQGTSDIEVVNRILYNEDNMALHIDAILTILKEKGYYGFNVSIVNLNPENREAYENYITTLSIRLKEAGYLLFVTITPKIILDSTEVNFVKVDYTVLGKAADYIQILSYGWGSFAGPPSPTTPAYLTNALLSYAVSMIPPSKIYSGISIIGYDWQSPYIIGVTKANSLTTDAAIELALQTGATISFDNVSMAPYYEYTVYIAGIQIRHTVWFTDARSIDALVGFVPAFGIQGVGIWNIMNYFAQMWLVINSTYQINKVLPEE